MKTVEEILDEVRLAIGNELFFPFQRKWTDATREDSIAMEQALKDLRARVALSATKGPIHDRGSWLFATWAKLRKRELAFRAGRGVRS